MHGIELSGMLYCEIDGYHTLDCDEMLSHEYLISVYNPNIEPLKGVFLSISRAMSHLRVSVLNSKTLDGPTLYP